MRATLGAAVMFVLLAHEFAASLLVRSPTVNTMGTIPCDLFVRASYPVVAAVARVMTAVTAAAVQQALTAPHGRR